MSTAKSQPYNPLDKLNLAKSIENELLGRLGMLLSEADSISGAGVYVIYYSGPFLAYAPIASANEDGAHTKPIYVGKAIPKGGRKGGLSRDVSASGKALADRLRSMQVLYRKRRILISMSSAFVIWCWTISGFRWARTC